jgi:hypothetical protein
VIQLKPDYGQAYQGLAEMVTFQSGDSEVFGAGELNEMKFLVDEYADATNISQFRSST